MLAFYCKYADRVEKRTNRRLLYKTPVSRLHLQTKDNHGREGEASIHVYGSKSLASYISDITHF